MIIAVVLVLASVVVGLWWLRRRARSKALALPLAGLDTGVRSVWRTPGGKLLGPRRGF